MSGLYQGKRPFRLKYFYLAGGILLGFVAITMLIAFIPDTKKDPDIKLSQQNQESAIAVGDEELPADDWFLIECGKNWNKYYNSGTNQYKITILIISIIKMGQDGIL